MDTKYLLLLILAILASLSCVAQTNNDILKIEEQQDLVAENVVGTTLKACCFEPKTGYFRDGYCRTDDRDYGTHTVCAIMTKEFLAYTKSMGNDLSTPFPAYNFPGLHPGDKWCLCASRWLEAYNKGVAPKVVLEATHKKSLTIVKLEYLKENAVIVD